MSAGTKVTRTQVWMDSLGDWSWPGQGGAAAEALPPPWVPAFPPRREPAAAPAAPSFSGRARRLIIAALLSGLAAVCVALALRGQLMEGVAGLSSSSPAQAVAAPPAPTPALQALPAPDR